MASIRKNSVFPHQVLLHVNDGSDGTLQWAQSEGIAHTHSAGNAGICKAVKEAGGLASEEYVVYMNDDMYVCPGWDVHIAEEIAKAGTDSFMFSSTMIEPINYNNPCVINKDYGQSIATFNEALLLKECAAFDKPEWTGSTWPPTIVHRKYWLMTAATA